MHQANRIKGNGVILFNNSIVHTTRFMSKALTWLRGLPCNLYSQLKGIALKISEFSNKYFRATSSTTTAPQEVLQEKNIRVFKNENIQKFEEGTCENFLRSEIFKPWLDTIRKTFQSHQRLGTLLENLEESELKTTLLALKEHLNSEPIDEKSKQYIYILENNRNYYQKLILLVRNCDATMDQYSNKASPDYELIEKIIYEFIQNFFLSNTVIGDQGMEMLYSHGLEQEMSLDFITNIPKKIKEASKKLSVNVRKPDFKGIFDPVLLGNISYVNYKCIFKGEKEIPIVRCPNLVSDRMHSNKKIYPMGEQYILFLKAYEKLGKVHMYVNMMNRTAGNEETRSKSIEETENKYPKATLVITIDRNSSFYLNGGNGNSAKMFKNDFLAHLFTRSYYWPNLLETSSWKPRVEKLIHHVHKDYFNESENLSQEERQAFIELTYMAIIDHLSKQFDPDSANYSCKNCIDRGELTQALMYLFQKTRSGKGKIIQKDLNHIIEILFLPALLVGDKVIDPKYLSRFILTATIMLDKHSQEKAVLSSIDTE